MQEGLSPQVVGPSTIFPRGFIWLGPLYGAAALLGLAIAAWLPLWYRLMAAFGIAAAVLTFVSVLSVITTRGFRVDRSGVRLGLPPGTRRRGKRREVRYLPWAQVDKVRIGRRRQGARVEVILSSGAALSARGHYFSPARRAWRALLLLIPFWYMLRPTGIATPVDSPPRYRVRLRGITVDELRQHIRALAPPNVTVTVLVRKSASLPSATSTPDVVSGAA